MINKYNASLELSRRLTERASAAWEGGEMPAKATPVTAALLRYWFDPALCGARGINFHIGQRRALMNVIYAHEILGCRSVAALYEAVAPDLLPLVGAARLAEPKYAFPKYAVKMATGTGKTWVMHALLLWQFLNARRAEGDARFTQRFLVVSPGLIVYDRLLDAFRGRATGADGLRDATTSDFRRNADLLIPPAYREEAFSFIANNTVTKAEGIGRKVTGEGLIALTNWHLFLAELEEDAAATGAQSGDVGRAAVSALLPVRPGKAAGNSLDVLDGRYLRGGVLDYLAGLPDLLVFNDEAHHIHRQGSGEAADEAQWQKGLDKISANKGSRFMQVDFSATPFVQRGTGAKAVRDYFPHVVADFDLPTAMRQGLVKTLLIDRRKELTELNNLDYRAVRDEGRRVIALGEGQRLMLRAGLTKLRRLERDFLAVDTRKYPKMLVVCEDTHVTPLVRNFLLAEGLGEDDVITIDSNRKGEVSEEEWQAVKARLFAVDSRPQPRVIVSVLMLREGFDVDNICVIVPLRAAASKILAEQTIGRGLRLMWRDDVYQSTKAEDRRRVLERHEEPATLLDMLSVIEHPAFLQLYKEYLADGLAVEDTGASGSGGAAGDLLSVGLRPGYARYDFTWPLILRSAEEELTGEAPAAASLAPFTAFPLETLRGALSDEGETFQSQEILSQTHFGSYKVSANLFSARTYNEYLQQLLRVVTRRLDPIGRRQRAFPNVQTGGAQLVAMLDRYIRTRLFGAPFDPFHGSDWKVLLARHGVVTQHIVREMAEAIYCMQQQVAPVAPQAELTPFSSVTQLRMRATCSQPTSKTIYARTPWPAHGGGLERRFALFLDRDAEVERFLKVDEWQHPFAAIRYLRTDGFLAAYHPDFLAATREKVYLIETKAEAMALEANVRQKQRAAVEWTRQVNKLPPADRMGREWEYVLVSEANFYALAEGGATLTDLCARCGVSLAAATGNLFADAED